MTPTGGRIVHYSLTSDDAEQINRRINDAVHKLDQHRENANGSIIHRGNHAAGGDVLPMLIVKVWAAEPDETTAVNGQVFVDGNHSLWVTSRAQGDGIGEWAEPPRV